jgi:D-methionine transport system ATP-binding protein
MIKIENLSKSYGNLVVLDDISLHIKKGLIFGVIGRSGAGKSTLLRCINGLEDFDSGRITVDNIQVNSLSSQDLRALRKDIGMIFQQFSLLNRLSVYDNIALPLRCWKYKEDYIDKKVKELLEIVGLTDKIKSKSRELSGGQKQRVAIARALSLDPKILLCDEATSALDPKTSKAITSLLVDINQQLGITIVVVTHQMSVLRRTCEEITILEDGKAAVTGDIEDIFMKQPPALRNLVGEKDNIIQLQGLNLKILLPDKVSYQPVFSQMAQQLNVDFVILGVEIDNYRDKILGSVFINASAADAYKIQKYLAKRQIIYEVIDNSDDAAGQYSEVLSNV